MDTRTLKQLQCKNAMREASPMYRQVILAEQIGTATLRRLHPKPSLLKRILRKV